EEVAERHPHPRDNAGKVEVFPPLQFWTLHDDGHLGKESGVRSRESGVGSRESGVGSQRSLKAKGLGAKKLHLNIATRTAVITTLARAISKKKTQPRRMSWS